MRVSSLFPCRRSDVSEHQRAARLPPVHDPRVERFAQSASAGHCAQPRRMNPTPVRITSAPIASAARSSSRPKPTSAALIASAASNDDSASVRTCQPLASSSADAGLACLAQHPVRQHGLAGECDGNQRERGRARLHDGRRIEPGQCMPDHLRAGYGQQRTEARERERLVGRPTRRRQARVEPAGDEDQRIGRQVDRGVRDVREQPGRMRGPCRRRLDGEQQQVDREADGEGAGRGCVNVGCGARRALHGGSLVGIGDEFGRYRPTVARK